MTYAAPSAPVPDVSGPVSGGNGLTLDVASVPRPDGYAINEYFFSGTATGYTNVDPLDSDGHWSFAPASTAPYTSRLVVIAPTDPKRFSGTVHVEWLNVSFTEAGGAYGFVHDEMLRTGDAYVGVSAQAKGVNALFASDPARYSALTERPGDTYSYDIFSQAGMAVREAAGTILPGLEPDTVIATGFSQSAARLVTYVNGVAPLTHVYDAYMLHARAHASSAPVSQAPQGAIAAPAVVRIRTDQQVPVLTFETETDAGPHLAARQPDSSFFRLWEVPGTAHFDASGLSGLSLTDDDSAAWHQQNFELMFSPPSAVAAFGISCPAPFNAGQHKYAAQAAYHALEDWAVTGVAPATRPRMNVDYAGNFIRDAHGNATGGVRTPAVDAPVATLLGDGSDSCILFGETQPFSAEKLASLYPKKNDFKQAWTAAVGSAERLGNLLHADAKALRQVVR